LYCEKPTDPSDRFAEKFGSLFIKIKKKRPTKLGSMKQRKKKSRKIKKKSRKTKKKKS
jgi:hypothetical protein